MFDAFSKSILLENPNKKIIIYGTGVLGEITFRALQKLNIQPDLFCDHDPNETIYQGIRVISPTRLCNYRDDIIIVAFKDYIQEALRNLDTAGCNYRYNISELLKVEGIDENLSPRAKELLSGKIDYSVILKVAEMGEQIIMQHCEIFITERCTLRCKDCSALIPYFLAPQDIDFCEFESLNRLLDAVDMISEVSVLGGEPLLHKNLSKILTVLLKSNKVGKVALYTNGTIFPQRELMEVLKHPKVWVHISEYNNSKQKTKELEAILLNAGIQCYRRQYDFWIDAGNLHLRSKNSLRAGKLFSRCFKAKCYSFYKGKLYGCVRASNGVALGKIAEDDIEYVDFNIYRKKEDLRNEIKQRLLSVPYFKSCYYCDGMISEGNRVFPAIQCNGQKGEKETGETFES